jgi:hypothetical protein
MNEYVAVILDNPEIVAFSLRTEELVALFFHLLYDVVGDCPYLGSIGAVANDKIIGNSAVNAAKIQ